MTSSVNIYMYTEAASENMKVNTNEEPNFSEPENCATPPTTLYKPPVLMEKHKG